MTAASELATHGRAARVLGITTMHFGGICVPSPSHVMCAGAIGRALEKRGHRFTFFSPPHMKPWNDKQGLTTVCLAESPELASRLAEVHEKRGKIAGTEAIPGLIREAAYVHAELPSAIERAGVECMAVDGGLLGAASAAEAVGVPFVNFFCAVPQHEEPAIPPVFLPWSYNDRLWARMRNRSFACIRDFFVRPLLKELNRFRQERRLALYQSLGDDFSQLAQVSQLVPECDFPRTQLPGFFHYVGPYYRDQQAAAIPFELAEGRPLVYAALGTILGSNAEDIWRPIAQACAELPVQLVIARGTKELPDALTALPGNPVVLGYAPQEALLARASLFIMQGGLNSAMESMAHGVPMLAIPLMSDQFSVGARIVYHGLGKTVGKERREPDALRTAITELQTNSKYRERCHAMAQIVRDRRGGEQAAAIFEEAAVTRRPVLRMDFKCR